MTDEEHKWWFDDVGNILCDRHPTEFYWQGEFTCDWDPETQQAINVKPIEGMEP